VLAIAAGLGALVAKDGADGVELDWLRQDVHAVLDKGADDAGGELGPQGQRIVALVDKGVHLLFDNVGGVADAAGEKLGGFKDGHIQPPKARPLRQLTHIGAHVLPVGLLLGQGVEGAGRALETGHGFSPSNEYRWGYYTRFRRP